MYALYTAAGGMALALLALGTLPGAARAFALDHLGVRPALYLVAMGGIMPITGVGSSGASSSRDPRSSMPRT